MTDPFDIDWSEYPKFVRAFDLYEHEVHPHGSVMTFHSTKSGLSVKLYPDDAKNKLDAIEAML